MLVAPANTPGEIAGKLHAELKAILALPESRQWIVKNGLTPAGYRSPDEMHGFIGSEITRWGKVLEQIGIARSQ
jgi:tripartite-type tricarboxylate transporter receptor subunit TctC